MTAIHQNSLSSHHSIDDAGHHSGNSNGGDEHARQATNNSTGEPNASTVNISYQAVLRLKAYQEQKKSPESQTLPVNRPEAGIIDKNADSHNKSVPERQTVEIDNPGAGNSAFINNENQSIVSEEESSDRFPRFIDNLLTEVQDNLVQLNEPGYRYLMNLLNNHGDNISNPEGLQEVMRKEQFFLTRRKPFMNSSEFHSYSQVLNQFANIVGRQQTFS